MQLLAVGHVSLEGVLHADRNALRLLLEPTRIDSAGAIAQNTADAARQQGAKLHVPEGGERTDGRDSGGDQTLLRLGSDARQAAHVERPQEARLLAGRDNGQSAGL